MGRFVLKPRRWRARRTSGGPLLFPRGDRPSSGRVLIVPAAGLGTRLRTTLPKVLAPVNGRPMLDWLLDLYGGVVDRAIVVVHPSFADQIRTYGETTGAPLEYQVQETPTGMLDAILCATPAAASSDASRILIPWC